VEDDGVRVFVAVEMLDHRWKVHVYGVTESDCHRKPDAVRNCLEHEGVGDAATLGHDSDVARSHVFDPIDERAAVASDRIDESARVRSED